MFLNIALLIMKYISLLIGIKKWKFNVDISDEIVSGAIIFTFHWSLIFLCCRLTSIRTHNRKFKIAKIAHWKLLKQSPSQVLPYIILGLSIFCRIGLFKSKLKERLKFTYYVKIQMDYQ